MTKPWRSLSSNSCAIRPAASPRRSGCPASRRTAAACAPRCAASIARPVGGEVARRVAVDEHGAARRPAAPRLRRSDRTDSGRPRVAPSRVGSITVCASANSASREPFTGSTWRAAGRAPRRSAAAASRRRPRAAPARRRWPGTTTAAGSALTSACFDQRRRGVARLADAQADRAAVGASGRCRVSARAAARTGRGAAWRATGSWPGLSRSCAVQPAGAARAPQRQASRPLMRSP